MWVIYKGLKPRVVKIHKNKKYSLPKNIAVDIPREAAVGYSKNLGYGLLNEVCLLGGKDKKHPRDMEGVENYAKERYGQDCVIQFVNDQYQTYKPSKLFFEADEFEIDEAKELAKRKAAEKAAELAAEKAAAEAKEKEIKAQEKKAAEASKPASKNKK